MSAMYARAMARCESMKSVLAAVKDAPGFVKHAQNQALCLHNALKDLSLNEDQVADCSSRIAQIGFPADIETNLLESIMEANHPETAKNSIWCRPKRPYRKLQNYEGFIDFIRFVAWKKIEDAVGADVVKFLFEELLNLGLRHPSCPTYGMVATVLSLLQYGETVTMDKTKSEKWQATKYIKKLFKSFAAQSGDPPVHVVDLPRDVETFQKQYPSLAKPYYKNDTKCGHPFDSVMVSAIAHMWPLRGPSPEKQDMDSSMLSKCMMNFMKMVQPNKVLGECPIDIYADRLPLKSALARGASSRFDGRFAEEEVRTDATPDTKSEAIVPVKDASVDEIIEKAKAVLFSALSPHNNKSVDPLIPFEKPKVPIVDSVDKVKDDDEFTSASLLKALLDREDQKKKDQAEKRKKDQEEKRRNSVLKRPAAEPSLSKVKRGKHTIPPLGCSKCRYLLNGCSDCRKRREQFVVESFIKKK